MGDTIEVKGVFTNGTTTAAFGTFTLPNSYTIDTAKIELNTADSALSQYVGFIKRTAANNTFNVVACTSTSTSLVYLGRNDTTASNLFPANVNNEIVAADINQIQFSFPASGLTNNN